MNNVLSSLRKQAAESRQPIHLSFSYEQATGQSCQLNGGCIFSRGHVVMRTNHDTLVSYHCETTLGLKDHVDAQYLRLRVDGNGSQQALRAALDLPESFWYIRSRKDSFFRLQNV